MAGERGPGWDKLIAAIGPQPPNPRDVPEGPQREAAQRAWRQWHAQKEMYAQKQAETGQAKSLSDLGIFNKADQGRALVQSGRFGDDWFQQQRQNRLQSDKSFGHMAQYKTPDGKTVWLEARGTGPENALWNVYDQQGNQVNQIRDKEQLRNWTLSSGTRQVAFDDQTPAPQEQTPAPQAQPQQQKVQDGPNPVVSASTGGPGMSQPMAPQPSGKIAGMTPAPAQQGLTPAPGAGQGDQQNAPAPSPAGLNAAPNATGPAAGSPASPAGPAAPPESPVGRPAQSWGSGAGGLNLTNPLDNPTPGATLSPSPTSAPGTPPPQTGAADPSATPPGGQGQAPSQPAPAPGPGPQPMVMNRMLEKYEVDLLPEGASVQTPMGLLTKGPGGATVQLNEQGKAAYRKQVLDMRQKMSEPFSSILPGGPELQVEVGKPNFDPISGQWL